MCLKDVLIADLANHVVAVDPRLGFHGQAGIHVHHCWGNQVAFGVMEGEILYYSNQESKFKGEKAMFGDNLKNWVIC